MEGLSEQLLVVFFGGVIGGVTAYAKGKDVWVGVAEGAIAGAVVDITVATGGTGGVIIAAAAIGGGTGSAIGDVAGQVLQSTAVEGKSLSVAVQNIDYNQTVEKGITGTITGAAGGAIGVGVGKATSAIVNSTKGVQATMSKNITETTKTLNSMGASQETTSKAVNKIVEGIGNAGRTTNNVVQTMTKVSTVVTEVSTKTVPTFKIENFKPEW